jgi:hypothetical protein
MPELTTLELGSHTSDRDKEFLVAARRIQSRKTTKVGGVIWLSNVVCDALEFAQNQNINRRYASL